MFESGCEIYLDRCVKGEISFVVPVIKVVDRRVSVNQIIVNHARVDGKVGEEKQKLPWLSSLNPELVFDAKPFFSSKTRKEAGLAYLLTLRYRLGRAISKPYLYPLRHLDTRGNQHERDLKKGT